MNTETEGIYTYLLKYCTLVITVEKMNNFETFKNYEMKI